MSLFRDLERSIDERLRRLFQSDPQPGQVRELVEVHHMILDAVENKVQMLPRARRAFPYNEVTVRVPASYAEQMAAFETVDGDVREFLQRERIEFPPDMRVSVETAELAEQVVICRMLRPEAAAPVSVELRPVRFVLGDGSTVEVTRGRVHVGRQPEVLDGHRRLVRRNDVVIESETVSRAHAHLEFAAGEWRLFDDGSSYGTSVIHEGRLVEVPRAGGRGLRLRSGDEVYFGQVRARFEILTGQ
jgi:hypothetical protein